MNAPATDSLDAYPVRTREKVRYSDTDRQGHVNNVMFAAYFEAGRVEALYALGDPAAGGQDFVAARVTVDFLAPVDWPGEVEIGTRVEAIGRSSVTFSQVMYQNGALVARSSSVLVLADAVHRRSCPLPDALRTAFTAMMTAPPA